MSEIFHSGGWYTRPQFNVYTGGTFDLFHYGHVNLLRQCREIANGGRVTVSVNPDNFVASYKQPPVCTLEERVAVLQACRYVDEVIVNWGGSDSKAAILSVMPHLIVIGSDWKDKDYNKQMGFSDEWLKRHNMQVVYVPYTSTISTTELRERLK
jgi:glycerol-3-phosphate cytidylyltransferase